MDSFPRFELDYYSNYDLQTALYLERLLQTRGEKEKNIQRKIKILISERVHECLEGGEAIKRENKLREEIPVVPTINDSN